MPYLSDSIQSSSSHLSIYKCNLANKPLPFVAATYRTYIIMDRRFVDYINMESIQKKKYFYIRLIFLFCCKPRNRFKAIALSAYLQVIKYMYIKNSSTKSTFQGLSSKKNT